MHKPRRRASWGPFRDWGSIFTAQYNVFLAIVALLSAAPFLSRLRETLPWLVLSALLATVVIAYRRRSEARVVVALVATFVVALGSATMAEMEHDGRRARVFGAEAARIEPVSRHLLVGYRRKEDIEALLERFDFAGVFVTARNAAGKSREELAAEIAALQAIQARHGRAPLMIATDQEGGNVARLSGPLPWRASLAAFGDDDVAVAVERARGLGEETAADLRSVGVNVNFAPVVDLRLADAGLTDRNSRISERAIAADPEKVARVAKAYAQAMTEAGVMPVAKHFPGLGRLHADTHVSDAILDARLATLVRTDWLPFRELAQAHASAVMVGHAIVPSVDSAGPASTSAAVVTSVLRTALGHDGLVFSDDLCMAPTYRRGVARSARAALAAGVDVLLVTYDLDVVYEILAALAGEAAPAASDRRLDHARRHLAPPSAATVARR
ncbi:MAG: glycoside hydrolase family 3 protein [Deltaproteobacteria bacterium]|nr:glycoside hydrolase family 3 protein [Deltaproteobacteria bacterium]